MTIMNRNLLYLKLIDLLNGLVFYAPVALLLRTSRGITIPQFFSLQIILYLTTCFAEIPCGLITDRIRYKNTIVLAMGVMTLARIQFIFADSFYIFVIEAILEGIAISFMSGTMNAYIYQLLGEKDFEKNISSIDNYGTAGFILSTILFSFIYKIGGMNTLVILTVIFTLIAFIISFYLQESDYKENTKNSLKETKLFKRSSFWKISTYSSIFSLGMIVINYFYVVKLETFGINEMYMSGVILLYSFVQLVIPKILDKLNKNNTQCHIKAFLSLAGICFLILYFSDNIIVTLLMMSIISTVIMIPYYIFSGLQNNYIDQLNLYNNRATILSIFNMGNNIVSIASFIFFSMNVNIDGLNIFLMVGILYIIIAILYKNIYIENK